MKKAVSRAIIVYIKEPAMNNKYFSENIRAYLDKIRSDSVKQGGEAIKSDAQAIKCLIDKISLRVEDGGVSERAVRKWLSGESLPEAGTLIILSEITGVSVDELLKDKAIDCGILPKWYADLSEESKKILTLALEAYQESELPVFDNRKIQLAEMLKLPEFKKACNFTGTDEDADNLREAALLLKAYFYFKVTASDDELVIATDSPLNYKEVVERETKRHAKKYRAERISEWVTKNRDASLEKYVAELPKLIDIGYFENEFPLSPFYYDRVQNANENDDFYISLDDSETEAWNEVPYCITEKTDLLEKYKTNLTVRASERFLAGVNRQIAIIGNKYFDELQDKGIVIYGTRFVKFSIGDDFSPSDSDYLRVDLTFTVAEDELRKVLIYNYKQKLESRKREIKKARDAAEQSAKMWRDLSIKIDKEHN